MANIRCCIANLVNLSTIVLAVFHLAQIILTVAEARIEVIDTAARGNNNEGLLNYLRNATQVSCNV